MKLPRCRFKPKIFYMEVKFHDGAYWWGYLQPVFIQNNIEKIHTITEVRGVKDCPKDIEVNRWFRK